MERDKLIQNVRKVYNNNRIVCTFENDMWMYFMITKSSEFTVGDVLHRIKVDKKNGQHLTFDFDEIESIYDSLRFVDVSEEEATFLV